MNIRFLELARIELDDSISWYEIEQENLGRLFLEEVSFGKKRGVKSSLLTNFQI